MRRLVVSIFAIFILLACSNDDDSGPTQCEIAIEASLAAKQDFDSATEENYVQACNAYKVALQNQQQACGDSNGSIQALIDGLGDCSDPSGNVEGQISVTAGTLNVVFDVLTIVDEGGLLKVSGETSAANSYSIYFEVEVGAEGDDLFQNFEIHLISTYYPMASNFNNTVTTNTSGTLTGTFSGIVENNDGGQIGLTNGNFDLSY